jgi:hypothetical protein
MSIPIYLIIGLTAGIAGGLGAWLGYTRANKKK